MAGTMSTGAKAKITSTAPTVSASMFRIGQIFRALAEVAGIHIIAPTMA